MMHIDATATFQSVAPGKTLLEFEQDFRFKGLANHLVGYLMKGQIKKQQQAHIAGFKRFVER